MSERSTQERLADLERRVAELERGPTPSTPVSGAEGAGAEDLWVLKGLEETVPDGTGAVVYAGRLDGDDGPLGWQYGLTVDQIDGLDWSDLSGTLDALGHPVRLAILKAVCSGVSTVAELKEREGFGTTGQIYHHVNLLASAGWLTTRRRGHYVVPADRRVPLLVILTAAKGVL